MAPRRSLVLLFALLGCTVIPEHRSNVADGLACEASSECASKSCAEGYCAGRGCKVDDPSTCQPGWQCVSSPGFLWMSGSVQCIPLCGACPGNMHCPVGGADRATPCEEGAPRKVTIVGPDHVKVGVPVTYSVKVDPPYPKVLRVEWLVSEQAGKGNAFGGETETITSSLGIDVEEDLFVTAIVHGQVRENAFESAGGTLAVHNACLSEGDVCDPDGQGYDFRQTCCAEGLYCPGQTGSTAPQYCAKLP